MTATPACARRLLALAALATRALEALQPRRAAGRARLRRPGLLPLRPDQDARLGHHARAVPDEYHVPLLPPELAAWLGTAGELVLPVLLVLGPGRPLRALGLSVVNVVAVLSLAEIARPALQQHVFWGSLLVGLALWGPGAGRSTRCGGRGSRRRAGAAAGSGRAAGTRSASAAASRPSGSRGSTAVRSIARNTASSQAFDAALLTSRRPMMVPSGATLALRLGARVAGHVVGEHDVGLDARLDAAGIARRRAGALRRGAGAARRAGGAGLARHALQVLVAQPRSPRRVGLGLLLASRARPSCARPRPSPAPRAWPSRPRFCARSRFLRSPSRAPRLLAFFLSALCAQLLFLLRLLDRDLRRRARRRRRLAAAARRLRRGLGGGSARRRRLRLGLHGARRRHLRHRGPQLGLDARRARGFASCTPKPARSAAQRAPAARASAPRPHAARAAAASKGVDG